MKVRFLIVAEKEVDDAYNWYNQQADGLGRDFLDGLDRAIRRAGAFPLSCPKIEQGTHRCLMARFPYSVVYGLEHDAVIVVAVAHFHRQPRYRADRYQP